MGHILEGELFYTYLQGISTKEPRLELKSIINEKYMFNNKLTNKKNHSYIPYLRTIL